MKGGRCRGNAAAELGILASKLGHRDTNVGGSMNERERAPREPVAVQLQRRERNCFCLISGRKVCDVKRVVI